MRTLVRCDGLDQRYPVLSELGVYEPICKYDIKTLGKDLSAHLVFGTASAAAFGLLSQKGGRK